MASVTFTTRFRNKIDKIGKEGLPVSESLKAIDKGKIPEYKVHFQISKLFPSTSKIMIAKNLNPYCKTPDPDHHESADTTPVRILPLLNRSPTRTEKISARSKSPIQFGYNRLARHDSSAEIANSCAKLPRICSGLKNIRMSIQKKLNLIN